mgnify:CR=1 FL=1
MVWYQSYNIFVFGIDVMVWYWITYDILGSSNIWYGLRLLDYYACVLKYVHVVFVNIFSSIYVQESHWVFWSKRIAAQTCSTAGSLRNRVTLNSIWGKEDIDLLFVKYIGLDYIGIAFLFCRKFTWQKLSYGIVIYI